MSQIPENPLFVRQLLDDNPAPWIIFPDEKLPQFDVFDASGHLVTTFEDTADERTFHFGIVAAVNLVASLQFPPAAAKQSASSAKSAVKIRRKES